MANLKENQKDFVESGESVLVPGKRKKRLIHKFSFILFLVVVVLGVLYYKQHQELTRLKDPTVQGEYAKKQVEKVIEDMKKTVIISDDEEVKLVAIISGAENLKKDQPFYEHVQDGDYVFLLSKTARAVIWRPKTNIVVNFGVVDIQQPQNQPQQESTQEVKKEDKKQ